jgi:hypothetical protein
MANRNYTRASLSAGDRPGISILGGDTPAVNRQGGALLFKALLSPAASLLILVIARKFMDADFIAAAGGLLLGGPFLLLIRDLVVGVKPVLSLYADLFQGRLRLYRGIVLLAFCVLVATQAAGAFLLCAALLTLLGV